MEPSVVKRAEMVPSSWLFWWCRFQFFPSSKSRRAPESLENGYDHEPIAAHKPAGGWKSMPFILGNETCERLGSVGLLANFMVFLQREFHMDTVRASNVINIWSGVANFSPLLGAFLADAYLGRFNTIALSTLASFMGMLTMTLIAWVPELHPQKCKVQPLQCRGPTQYQSGVLVLALGLMTIGTAGIRPCSIAFGVDQFDAKTEEGRRGINSFFNWYYTTFTLILIFALTFIVYVQDSISWVWGFGIPTGFVFCSILLFFVGMRLYVYVKPEGSVFTGIVQVVVAAFRKRNLRVPDGGEDGSYFDPPLKGSVVMKLPLTKNFRFFNKAALLTDGEVSSDDSNYNPWRLCSIQAVEETKCIFRVIPIWASGIICFTAMVQQATFTISQASKMDRHLGHKFKVPPGTLIVVSMITTGVWLPFYDRVLVPSLRKLTGLEGGITVLQRMGIGIALSVLSMVVAGLVEPMRRASAAAQPDGIARVTVFWLAPQLALMGLAEAFNAVAQIEFYNKELPEHMSSVANALVSCSVAGASYMSAVLVNVVHKTTGRNGRPDWLASDTNAGKVENFYFVIAGLGVLNLVYFLWVVRGYRYKIELAVMS